MSLRKFRTSAGDPNCNVQARRLLRQNHVARVFREILRHRLEDFGDHLVRHLRGTQSSNGTLKQPMTAGHLVLEEDQVTGLVGFGGILNGFHIIDMVPEEGTGTQMVEGRVIQLKVSVAVKQLGLRTSSLICLACRPTLHSPHLREV